MIPADTKCTIKKVPGEGTFSRLLGANAAHDLFFACDGAGTQQLKLDSGAIYGNCDCDSDSDSGLVVEPK